MSGPALLFCSIAEREYNATVVLIESALVLPTFALRQLRSQVTLFKQLTLDANDLILTEMEEIVLSLLDVRKIKGFSNIEEKRLSFLMRKIKKKKKLRLCNLLVRNVIKRLTLLKN